MYVYVCRYLYLYRYRYISLTKAICDVHHKTYIGEVLMNADGIFCQNYQGRHHFDTLLIGP